MGKEIARVRPLIPAHAEDIGRLIDTIERGGKFEVIADESEKGSFKVMRPFRGCLKKKGYFEDYWGMSEARRL